VVDNKVFTPAEIREKLDLKQRTKFFYNYIQPALKADLIEMTIPDKPNSRLQKYRLTPKGIALKNKIQKPQK
jgi:predicted transcriptional regulator